MATGQNEMGSAGGGGDWVGAAPAVVDEFPVLVEAGFEGDCGGALGVVGVGDFEVGDCWGCGMQPCLGVFFGVDLDWGLGLGVSEMVEQADFGGFAAWSRGRRLRMAAIIEARDEALENFELIGRRGQRATNIQARVARPDR